MRSADERGAGYLTGEENTTHFTVFEEGNKKIYTMNRVTQTILIRN